VWAGEAASLAVDSPSDTVVTSGNCGCNDDIGGKGGDGEQSKELHAGLILVGILSESLGNDCAGERVSERGTEAARCWRGRRGRRCQRQRQRE